MRTVHRLSKDFLQETRNIPAHPLEFLSFIEEQLKMRLAYPYVWHGFQTNGWDNKTAFIYHIAEFQNLLRYLQSPSVNIQPEDKLFDYALARWYNHWSAQAVEKLFCLLPRVSPIDSVELRRADFKIDDILFDHKTSVFPKGYRRDLSYALNNKRSLIEWLYKNQSMGQRKHYRNRLFIVLFATHGEHWRLKAEITFLKTVIEAYMSGYDSRRLEAFEFSAAETTLSDIIWGVR